MAEASVTPGSSAVSIARESGIAQSPICSNRLDQQRLELGAVAAAGDKHQVSDVDGGDLGETERMRIGQQTGGARVRGG